MKKITNPSQMRDNLKAERKYEKTKRRNRNEETKLRMRAKRSIEKRL